MPGRVRGDEEKCGARESTSSYALIAPVRSMGVLNYLSFHCQPPPL